MEFHPFLGVLQIGIAHHLGEAEKAATQGFEGIMKSLISGMVPNEPVKRQVCVRILPFRAGPVIAGGMLFVNSGYARNGAISGNVLLAFAPED
jgi:hypothetical protein